MSWQYGNSLGPRPTDTTTTRCATQCRREGRVSRVSYPGPQGAKGPPGPENTIPTIGGVGGIFVKKCDG